jgi:hypothetical protein
MVFARKQRFSVVELAHYAADGPDIAGLAVAVGQQQLRRTVPSGSHVVCQRASIGWHLSSEAEVTQLQFALTELKELYLLTSRFSGFTSLCMICLACK